MEEVEEFGFALTLIAGIVTAIYTASNYFQNTSISATSGFILSRTISIIVLLCLYLVIYVLIKGISIGIRESPLKKSLDNIASDIYLASFLASSAIFITTLLYMFIAILFRNLWISLSLMLLISLLGLIICYVVIAKISKVQKESKGVNKFFVFILIAFAVGMGIWGQLSNLTETALLKGDILTDLDNIYIKDAQIPVNVHVEGVNNGLRVHLYRLSDTYLVFDEILFLEPNHNITDFSFYKSSVLNGNSLNNGNYIIFINTTSLNEGYYELCLTRPPPLGDSLETVNGFLLLNDATDNSSLNN